MADLFVSYRCYDHNTGQSAFSYRVIPEAEIPEGRVYSIGVLDEIADRLMQGLKMPHITILYWRRMEDPKGIHEVEEPE